MGRSSNWTENVLPGAAGGGWCQVGLGAVGRLPGGVRDIPGEASKWSDEVERIKCVECPRAGEETSKWRGERTREARRGPGGARRGPGGAGREPG